ncbi:MAG: hypothetical protein FJ096_01675 [Deltaproteobacteria bacterium]|nr:hypothetical protein [Deltaproteobacteria bacterium]
MKRIAFGAVVLAAMVSVGTAEAAKPLGPEIPKKALKLNDKLKAPLKPIKVDDLKGSKGSKFDLKKKYKTASGQLITGEEFLDVANKLQAAAEFGGCDLGSGKGCNFEVEDFKLDAGELKGTLKKAGFSLKLKNPKAAKMYGGAGNSGGEKEPEKKVSNPLGFQWERDWGNPKKAAVYVGAEFGNDGSSKSSACGGAAYAGVHLFNNKKEVIRLQGEVAAKKGSFVGSAELLLLGKEVWSESGKIDVTKKFEESYKVSQSWTYWGIVTLNLEAKVTAAASLTAGLSGVATENEYTCSVKVTPGAKVSVGGAAEVAIFGYGSVSAAAVGVEADLTLADLSLPVTLSASAKNQNGKVTFTESIKADIQLKYLSGSLDAYFKTNIPLDGECWLCKWDTDKFSFTLLEWDGYTFKEEVFKKEATQTL